MWFMRCLFYKVRVWRSMCRMSYRTHNFVRDHIVFVLTVSSFGSRYRHTFTYSIVSPNGYYIHPFVLGKY